MFHQSTPSGELSKADVLDKVLNITTNWHLDVDDIQRRITASFDIEWAATQ
jgi:hypothetical protein